MSELMLKMPNNCRSVTVTIGFGTNYKEITVGAANLLISSKRRVTGEQNI